ncbi:MAG: RNA 2',3'-cyclic phosphodiesterase [Dehalococcoidia bacterium]
MADAGPLRLFIAVELPEEIRQILAEVTARLRQQLGGPYRWVPAGNIHLTLRFLGDVEAGRVGALGEALAGGVRSLTPFTLSLEGTGTFPGGRNPSVVWAGLGGGIAALTGLRDAVETAMVAVGEGPGVGKFAAHLTLARVRTRLSVGEAGELTRLLSEVRYPDGASFEVRGASLIHSSLGPGGPSYATLAHAPLGAI